MQWLFYLCDGLLLLGFVLLIALLLSYVVHGVVMACVLSGLCNSAIRGCGHMGPHGLHYITAYQQI